MTALPCAIYKHVLQSSQYVYYFFNGKKTDGFEFLGWAKCKKTPEEGRIPQPIKKGFYCIPNQRVLPLIMPEGERTIWESISTSTPEENTDTATAEIDEHEVRIYKDGELWLTPTK